MMPQKEGGVTLLLSGDKVCKIDVDKTGKASEMKPLSEELSSNFNNAQNIMIGNDGKIVFTTEFDIKGAVDFVGEVDDGYIVSGIPQNWLGNDTECFYLYKLDRLGNLVYQRRIASNNVAGVVKAECVDGELVYYDRYVKSVIGQEYEFGYRMNSLNHDLSTRATAEVNGGIEELISCNYPNINYGPDVLWSVEDFLPDFNAGYVSSVIYYDDFVLIISERNTKWFEYVPMVYSSMPSYTETVYTAYTYDAEIIWRSAVDSTDYERLSEMLD